MIKLNPKVTDELDFFKSSDPCGLIREFGSPLYVYSEAVLRERCREMKSLSDYPNFKINYSAKANSNLYFLRTIKSEGLNIDALSPGEIYLEEMAGFAPEDILFISNNVSAEEMAFAAAKNITVSVDSLAQLELLGKTVPGARCSIRFNPGIGAGHHEKVITGGKKTKFGVSPGLIPETKDIIKKYGLRLCGINQHIGSLFMDARPYLDAAKELTQIAENFPDIEFIDFGGGFGIPYRKQEGEKRLDLAELGNEMTRLMYDFAEKLGRTIRFKAEPGRYIAAECGILLGTVHSVKTNGDDKYIGTDLGFNVLARPVLYDAYHDIEVYRESGKLSELKEIVTVVGNICETGDIIAKDRLLPEIFEGDVLGVLDAGAYGFSMSSNYNVRMRPAEIFITQDGSVKLTRRRDTFEDMGRGFL